MSRKEAAEEFCADAVALSKALYYPPTRQAIMAAAKLIETTYRAARKHRATRVACSELAVQILEALCADPDAWQLGGWIANDVESLRLEAADLARRFAV
jgi:hypothetical protein